MNTHIITRDQLDKNNTYIRIVPLEDFQGSIQISANLGTVKFRGRIKASESIIAEAGSGIEAGEGIKAGWGIKAGGTISCKLRIFAGLCIWRKPTQEEMQIRCEKLIAGEVCYGTLIEIPKPQPKIEEPSLSGKEVSVTLDGKTYKAIIQ